MAIGTTSGAALLRALVLAAIVSVGTFVRPALAQSSTTQQRTFATAEEAVTALVAAVQSGTPQALAGVLGPGSEKVVSSGDPYADKAAGQRFLAAYADKHELQADGPDRMLLDVGNNDWQLPIPIVRTNGAWHFDSAAGAQELVNRRIGRNEIEAIRTLLAAVDAEKAYFEITKAAGHPEYAERFVSTAGNRDGLYWPAESDSAESPLGPLVATAEAQGYPGELVSGKPSPYQGYFFRILKAQGPNAPGGAKDYVEGGHMTEGFAMVAWPAIYGASGIMTFIVDQDGTVFQQDLGSDTAAIVAKMQAFDPDLSWTRVDITGH